MERLVVSLIFNEAALVNLLEAPDGPYGQRLLLVAEQITQNYNDAIGGVWQDQTASVKPHADFEIDRGQFGLQAVIGIPADERRIADYMANKFANIEPDKFVPRIMAGWDTPL
jgi:hypothetical protein